MQKEKRPKFEHVNEALIQIPPADVTHVHRKWLDLPYAGLSPAQKLDLYLPPEGDGLFSVVPHIHGGAFAAGDKRDIQHGRIDAMLPVQQSMRLVQKLKETVGPDRFEFDIRENAGHGDPLFESDDNVFRLLNYYLK